MTRDDATKRFVKKLVFGVAPMATLALVPGAGYGGYDAGSHCCCGLCGIVDVGNAGEFDAVDVMGCVGEVYFRQWHLTFSVKSSRKYSNHVQNCP